jgi:hypothetical protein
MSQRFTQLNAEQSTRNDLSQSVSKLHATASNLGEAYDACSHAFIMVRETGIEELVETLRSEQAAEESKAEALRILLLQMQKSSERYTREHAAKALGQIAVFNDHVCKKVMQLMTDENSRVKEAAIMALRGRLQSDRIPEAIANVQKGLSAAYEVEQKLVELMHSLVDDENGRVRFAATAALKVLVNMFHTDSVVKVASRMTDPEEWIRRHAAEIICDALSSAEEKEGSLPASSQLVFMAEGWLELLASASECYELGKSLEGGGDVYMRKIAIKGMAVAGRTKMFDGQRPESRGASSHGVRVQNAAQVFVVFVFLCLVLCACVLLP